MKITKDQLEEAKRILKSCKGPNKYKVMIHESLCGKSDAMAEEPFAKYILEDCPLIVRRMLCENETGECIKLVTRAMLMNGYVKDLKGIVVRSDDFLNVVWGFMDVDVFNYGCKFNKRSGNKGVFIGAILLMMDYGYFKICFSNGKSVTKKLLWKFLKENFEVGDDQEFLRNRRQDAYKAAARKKVKIIEEIEAKRKT